MYICMLYIALFFALGISVLGKDWGVPFGVYCISCYFESPWGRVRIIDSFKVKLGYEIRLGCIYE